MVLRDSVGTRLIRMSLAAPLTPQACPVGRAVRVPDTGWDGLDADSLARARMAWRSRADYRARVDRSGRTDPWNRARRLAETAIRVAGNVEPGSAFQYNSRRA